jgi:hypothetical protein
MTYKMYKLAVVVGCVLVGFSPYAIAAIPVLLLALFIELLVGGLFRPTSNELDVSSNDFATVFRKAPDKAALRRALIAAGVPLPEFPMPAAARGRPSRHSSARQNDDGWAHREEESRRWLDDEEQRARSAADDDEQHRRYREQSDADDDERRHQDDDSSVIATSSTHDVNPATGLLMMDGGVDTGGSPYGIDIHDDHDSHGSIGGDSWDSTSSSAFDDSHSFHHQDD